jgi:chemotaxis protein methyltransferase CheR
LAEILALLRERRQFDLQNYKDRCIRRRIAKHLRARGARDVAGYLPRLAGDDRELDLLVEALAIHVSRFFRDPEVFRRLESQVLPGLYARLRAAGRTELRLWSAGCAEGEEAYSLALLVGALAPPGLPTTIQATDASEPALAQARAGLYAGDHLVEVPELLRAACFHEEGGRYRLEPRIRRMVEFRCHDLLTADPYPPADLILCRNVLYYFSQEEQARILCRFAAALPVGGVLVLGRTETLPRTEGPLFGAEFAGERIYRRLADSRP